MTLEQTYDRVASLYDILDYPFEVLYYQRMRRDFLTPLRYQDVLEIGVGTGKNLPYYHPSNSVVGLEPSSRMLRQARTRKNNYNLSVQLHNDTLENFKAEKMYDIITATFVLYLLDDLEEKIKRLIQLLKPGGKLIILEYTKPQNQIEIQIANILSKITKPMYGLDFDKINTLELLESEFSIIKHEDYMNGWLYGAILEKSSD